MGTVIDSIRTGLIGSGDGSERLGPALKSWEAIAQSEDFKKLLTRGLEGLTPLVGSWKAASKTQMESLTNGAIEALAPFMSSWEAVSRSEEFENLKANGRKGLQRVFGSFEAVTKSEEFKSLVTNALEGVQPAFKSLKAVSRSEEFKTFKMSSLSAVGTMTAGAVKKAGQSFGPAMVDRVGKVLGGPGSRTAE
jgi:hypothetical protein